MALGNQILSVACTKSNHFFQKFASPRRFKFPVQSGAFFNLPHVDINSELHPLTSIQNYIIITHIYIGHLHKCDIAILL